MPVGGKDARLKASQKPGEITAEGGAQEDLTEEGRHEHPSWTGGRERT